MKTRSTLPVLFALAGFGLQAAAFCPPPGFPPPARYVGDTDHNSATFDAKCTDNDIQSAINNATCPGTVIVVTREHTYTQQHLSIANRDITLSASGDGVACGASGGGTIGGPGGPTQPLVTISGNGSQSVFDIGGSSNVTFELLEITGGGGDHGGGIDFNGVGSLTLHVSTVDSNRAQFGAGIEMNGNGGAASLTLLDHSVIESNTASGNGGGINLEGNAQLLAIQPFTTIFLNHAPNGQGGGIAVVGPAIAYIGSPGYGGLAILDGNDAKFGGAIGVQGQGHGTEAAVSLFTTDADNPITLSGNFASSAGGAVYLRPSASDLGFTYFCAQDFRIDGNSAPEGTAIYADFDTSLIDADIGSQVFLNEGAGFCGSLVSAAVPCAKGIECNAFDGNAAKDSLNRPQAGSTLVIQQHGAVRAQRFGMRHNTGAHAIRLIDPELNDSDNSGPFAVISTCLIADNTLTAERISLEDQGGEDGTAAAIDSCTIANNGHTSGSAIHAEHNLILTRTIVDEPAMSTLSTGGTPTVTAQNILAADPTGLAAAPDIVAGSALFANAANGDYHQVATTRQASLGIDFAPTLGTQDPDLDGNPYSKDVPMLPNRFGTRDLGCYEGQPIADRIFADGLGDAISLLQAP